MKFLDIETNGLNPDHHQPIEVAWVDLDPDVLFREFSLDFNLGRSEGKALEVNGWGKRPFATKISHHYARELMLEELTDEIIVANNVAFDLAFLAAFLRRGDLEPPWKTTGYELKSLCAGRLGISPRLVSTELIEEHFKMEPVNKHTALEDARWNREIYLALDLYEG